MQTPVSAGIARNAEAFEGLYESLMLSADGQPFDSEAYEEWCDRAARLKDAEFRAAFASKFSKEFASDEELCIKKIRMLIGSIQRAGFVRAGVTGSTITFDEDAAELFQCLDHADAGAPCEVVKPAWMLDGKVIEMGAVRGKTGSKEETAK